MFYNYKIFLDTFLLGYNKMDYTNIISKYNLFDELPTYPSFDKLICIIQQQLIIEKAPDSLNKCKLLLIPI